MKYNFFCDFDGVVTKEDVIDRILEEFADPLWRTIEQSWINGEMGSRDCLTMQTKLIRAKESDLLHLVEEIDIDESFIDFASYCKSNALGIVIISDGIDLFIRATLNRYGLNDIRIYANSLQSATEGYEMLFPYSREDCLSRSGLCKCKMIEKLSDPMSVNILVGDGRSDFCVADKVDLTFAKSTLLHFCRIEKIPYIEFGQFKDISVWLKNQIG